MPMCGFSQTMLGALTVFSKGLMEQILKRSREDKISIERAFEIEVEELNIFLRMNSDMYHEQLRPKYGVEESMKKLLEWSASGPKSGAKK